MRYYCESCKSEFITKYSMCKCSHCYYPLYTNIPDFETPAQYENRTGKKLSTEAAVWIKCRDREGFISVRYDNATRQNKYFYWKKYLVIEYILVANSPEPPPDDWRPS